MQGYEAFSKFYADGWSEDWSTRIKAGVIALLKRQFPKKKRLRILDVACGAGHAAGFLERAGHDVYGIDGSKTLLRGARRIAPTSEFIHWNFGEPFPQIPPCDVVVCFYDSLNHAKDAATVKQVLQEISGVLRPGGMFLCDYNSIRGFAKRWAFTVRIDRSWGWCESRFSYDPIRKRGVMRAKGILNKASGKIRFDEEYLELPLRKSELRQWLVATGIIQKAIPQPIRRQLPVDPGREWLMGLRA